MNIIVYLVGPGYNYHMYCSLYLSVTLHPRTTVALEYTTVILSCMAKDSVVNSELQVNGTYRSTVEHNIDYLNFFAGYGAFFAK